MVRICFERHENCRIQDVFTYRLSVLSAGALGLAPAVRALYVVL